MLEGRDRVIKKDLIKNVTTAITGTLQVPDESVRVLINEMPYENFGVAGLPIREYREKKK
jgi:4-oxalocrotonate tautomerase